MRPKIQIIVFFVILAQVVGYSEDGKDDADTGDADTALTINYGLDHLYTKNFLCYWNLLEISIKNSDQKYQNVIKQEIIDSSFIYYVNHISKYKVMREIPAVPLYLKKLNEVSSLKNVEVFEHTKNDLEIVVYYFNGFPFDKKAFEDKEFLRLKDDFRNWLIEISK